MSKPERSCGACNRPAMSNRIGKFDLDVVYAAASFAVGEPIRLCVTVVNMSDKVLPEGMLGIVPDSYHVETVVPVPAVPPFQTCALKLEVKVRYTFNPSHLPLALSLEYHQRRFTVSHQMGTFTRSITDRQPAHAQKYNILVFGEGGDGKSSLICKFATLLSGESRPQLSFAPVGGSDRHCTRKLVRYALPQSCINVWDTWGWNIQENYRDNTLAYILEGALPSNWEMGEMLASRMSALHAGENTKHDRRIHGAILAFGPSVLDAKKDPNFRKALVKLFRAFRAFTPVVVVSKIDQLGRSWSEPDSDPYWLELKKEVAELCCVTPNSVFFNSNYVVQRDRSGVLDKQTLEILDEVMARAVRFEAQYGSPGVVLPHEMTSGATTPAQAYEW